MPRDNRAPPVKLYYRIGEVAALVGVETHVLRYWESEFPTIRPQKSRSGQRVYSRRDIEKLLRVKDLLYAQRFTIAGARQRLRGPAPVAQAAEGQLGAEALVSSVVESQLAPEMAEPALLARESNRDELAREQAEVEPAIAQVTPVVAGHSSDGARAAAATALRSALLAVREQLIIMLDRVDGGANESNP